MPRYDHRIDSPGRRFVDSYHAPVSRANIEQRKIVARHPGDENALRRTSDLRQTQESDTVPSDVLEEVQGGTAIVLEIFERDATKGSAGGWLTGDHDDPVGIPHRQGSHTIAFTTLKTAVLTPIPSPSVTIVASAKPGDLRSIRSPYPMSCKMS